MYRELFRSLSHAYENIINSEKLQRKIYGIEQSLSLIGDLHDKLSHLPETGRTTSNLHSGLFSLSSRATHHTRTTIFISLYGEKIYTDLFYSK